MDNNIDETKKTNLEENNTQNEVTNIENDFQTDTNNYLKEDNRLEENSIEKKKKDKKNNILIICLIGILVLLVGSYFVLSKVLVKEDTKPNEEEKQDTKDEEKKEEKKDDEEVLVYNLNVYKGNSGYLCQEYTETYCKDIAFTIKTKTEHAKIVKIDDNFVLYEDDGLKVYNNYDGNIIKLNLANEYQNYDIHYVDTKLLGILYYTEDENYCKYALSGYYNISNQQKMYDNKYSIIYKISNSEYLNASRGSNIYLLNANQEKEELSSRQSYISNGEICYVMGSDNFYIYSNNDKHFYYITDADGYNAYKFYSNDKKIILDKKISEGSWSFKDKYLYVVDDKVVKKFDIDGSLVAQSKTFDDVKGVIENYIVYVENNNLSLMNIDSEQSVVLDKWNNNYRYDNWAISGVYTREKLDSMNEKDKPEGVYVVIYYKEKDENGNYGKEYCYTKSGEIKTFDITQPEGGRAKPVLYLYPTETTNVKIEFEHPEYLTTTYPKYNSSWKLTAYPNGDLYDKDNKYYYALYWDEVRYNEVSFNEGFYVTKDNAIDFLEEKLEYIGLNNRERNEFIMYWLPILENNEKSIVYFELTKEREKGNKLIITPKPDSMLRVSIHIKKINEKVNIKEQKLEKFERFGFTAIEWGGMTY